MMKKSTSPECASGWINENKKGTKITSIHDEKLKMSIEYLTIESNDTGSSYGFEANDFINKSLSYQHKRNNIVLDNQRLFK